MFSVAQGENIVLSAVTYDEFGAPANASAIAVDIIDPAGTVVVTDAIPTNVGTGQYEYTYAVALDATISNQWKARWNATVNGTAIGPIEEFFEVTEAGDHYFTIAEARAFRNAKLADTTKYPTADIEAARDEVEEFIEEIIGYACVPRTRTVTLDGDAATEVFLPDIRVTSITSVTVDGTAYDAAVLADLQITDYGSLRRKTLGYFALGWGNVVVTYVHGLAECPGPIKRAALILLYNRLVGSDVSDRALSFTNESGTLQYSTPNGMHRATGIPEVDSILWKYSDHRVGVA